jgi:hypothetical protein
MNEQETIRERLNLADRTKEELEDMRDNWALDTYEFAAVSDELDSIEAEDA